MQIPEVKYPSGCSLTFSHQTMKLRIHHSFLNALTASQVQLGGHPSKNQLTPLWGDDLLHQRTSG